MMGKQRIVQLFLPGNRRPSFKDFFEECGQRRISCELLILCYSSIQCICQVLNEIFNSGSLRSSFDMHLVLIQTTVKSGCCSIHLQQWKAILVGFGINTYEMIHIFQLSLTSDFMNKKDPINHEVIESHTLYLSFLLESKLSLVNVLRKCIVIIQNK